MFYFCCHTIAARRGLSRSQCVFYFFVVPLQSAGAWVCQSVFFIVVILQRAGAWVGHSVFFYSCHTAAARRSLSRFAGKV